MKTLDEVIKAKEICSQMDAECSRCPYKATAKGWCEEKDRDALHYLKEYRWIVENCADALAEKYPSENVPLTWDELKHMEGKPVWVEHDTPSTKYQRWVLVCEYTDTNKITIIANHLLTQIMPDDYGNTWQAYRKERK